MKQLNWRDAKEQKQASGQPANQPSKETRSLLTKPIHQRKCKFDWQSNKKTNPKKKTKWSTAKLDETTIAAQLLLLLFSDFHFFLDLFLHFFKDKTQCDKASNVQSMQSFSGYLYRSYLLYLVVLVCVECSVKNTNARSTISPSLSLEVSTGVFGTFTA